MLRVAVTDDHTLFRKSLSFLINSFKNMEVVLEASNGQELLEKLKHQAIDILLLDLQMPKMDGFETYQRLNTEHPDIKVLVLTSLSEAEIIRKIMELGVHGYFTKNTDPNELERAILKLNEDGFYFEKSLANIIKDIIDTPSLNVSVEQPVAFTERETEILRLTLKEYSGIEIADTLYISPKTVEKHKRNLMEKTQSKNFIGVIMYAFSYNILSLNELKN